MFDRLSSQTSLTLLAVPVLLGLLYAALTPLGVSSSTWVAFGTLLLGMAIVTFNTANNAQPTGSLGRLLYETENPRRDVAGSSAPTIPPLLDHCQPRSIGHARPTRIRS